MTEEPILYVAMILAATPTVIAAFAKGGPFDGGASLCLALIALGLAGLGARVRRRRRVPRADIRR